MRKFLTAVSILLLSFGLVWAQDPEGELDSCYIVCGADGYPGFGEAEVCFQIRFHSDNTGDNRLTGFTVPVIITGNTITSVDMSIAKAAEGSVGKDFQWIPFEVVKFGNPDPTVPPFHMVYTAYTLGNDPDELFTGDGILANICLIVSDTGTICVDTLSTDFVNLGFGTVAAPFNYVPHWSGPFCCQVVLCEAKAGDANGDKNVNLIDIVYNVNYVFKGGPAPSPLCQGDSNGDSMVDLIDIVYETNYVFREGPAPLKNGSCCL